MDPRPLPLLMALGVDFDGTLTEGGCPADRVLEDLSRLRAGGSRVVLVTGRILSELRAVFPDVTDFFDAIVCENGGVIMGPDGVRRLAEPIPTDLDQALSSRGVQFRRGDVLVACKANAAAEALDAVHALGIDAQLVFNRSELMILPGAVSKASGLAAALRALGLSPHNAAAIGDAENDHAMLHACELAVAPANAVRSLKAHADLVLPQPDGAAVSELAARVLGRGALPCSGRWSVQLGVGEHHEPVTLPVTATSFLIAGSTSSGKSYLAGLIAEQLIEQGYDTLVIDPEGDHVGLRRLPNVVWLGGDELPRDPRSLGDLVGSPMGNVVVDLSHLTLPERTRWLAELPDFLVAQRVQRGSPHWVIIDEAHLIANDPARVRTLFQHGLSQYCFVTFFADLLDESLHEHLDALAFVGRDHALPGSLRDQLVRSWDADPHELEFAAADAAPGTAAIVLRSGPGSLVRCRLRSRFTSHVRHWHKYATERMPQHAFHLRSSSHQRTGQTAASLAELHDHLGACEPSVIVHHAAHADFSRWAMDVISDPVLAAELHAAECSLAAGAPTEVVRARLVEAIRARYLTD